MRKNHRSEHRAEYLLKDLLETQGWDLRSPPSGQTLVQNEYRQIPELADCLARASKSGSAHGIPEFILLGEDRRSPVAVIETKRSPADIGRARQEAQRYAEHLAPMRYPPLAIGLAGTEKDGFALSVSKLKDGAWSAVTYDDHPISWIPNPVDMERLVVPAHPTEIRPTIPPMRVLSSRADEINRLLREAHIKDELRPANIAAIMLALWSSKGQIRRQPEYILLDINQSCGLAFQRSAQPDLAGSLRVDEANQKLAVNAIRIAVILERLNITVLTAEHDYLGHLYEAFFRYTGGNTIGQYFTPRHITRFMADLCLVGQDDVVLDPACGTGGFLIACMDRLVNRHNMSRAEMVSVIQRNLMGFEDEPITAALCVTNMILRGDGSTLIRKDDCFSAETYPHDAVDVVLSNPPFPHRSTDTPPEVFVDRGLEALRNRGKMAVILPTSILVKADKADWRKSILEKHRLIAVCQLPDELFQPFASATTSIVVLEKGVPNGDVHETTFARITKDGYTLRKGVRMESAENELDEALGILLNKKAVAGFSGMAQVSAGMEWAAGAYVAQGLADADRFLRQSDDLIRRLVSFYTRYTPQILEQRSAIETGMIQQVNYEDILSEKRRDNAERINVADGEIGAHFRIYYGLGAIESRDGIPEGRTLIISPTEQYNGCYGWLEFPFVLTPPFITVARTGSIGEAFVHLEPCAPNSDCLVLLPVTPQARRMDFLVCTAAAIREEKWRYNYGRKITPNRLASVAIPDDADIHSEIMASWSRAQIVVEAAFSACLLRRG